MTGWHSSRCLQPPRAATACCRGGLFVLRLLVFCVRPCSPCSRRGRRCCTPASCRARGLCALKHPPRPAGAQEHRAGADGRRADHRERGALWPRGSAVADGHRRRHAARPARHRRLLHRRIREGPGCARSHAASPAARGAASLLNRPPRPPAVRLSAAPACGLREVARLTALRRWGGQGARSSRWSASSRSS